MAAEHKTVECSYREGATRSDLHFHNAYEVMYVVSGRIILEIDNREYEAGPDNLVFISNFEEHHYKILEEPCRRFFLTLDTEKIGQAIGDPELISILKNRPEGFDHCVNMGSDRDLVLAVYEKLYDECRHHEEPYSEELETGMIRMILILASRKIGAFHYEAQSKFQKEIYEIQRYMEDHYTEDIQIASLARKYYMDPYYLSHCFKKSTGYSPKRFLLLTRLAKAKDLLLHSNLLVSEVAFKSGFQDTNNFIRYFKREVGMTPNRYRKTYEQEMSERSVK